MTTGLLRRPDVAFKAMSDDTARHQVNHAQVERSRQAREDFEENSPIAPAIRAIDRSVEFLDLVTACHTFVESAGRTVPGLRDRQLGDDERVLVHENVALAKYARAVKAEAPEPITAMRLPAYQARTAGSPRSGTR